MLSDTLASCLDALLSRHGLKKGAVIEAAQIERSYGYQLFSGRRGTPSRDVLLSLALAMHLSVEETQTLLRTAGLAMLYPRVPGFRSGDPLRMLLAALGYLAAALVVAALLSTAGSPAGVALWVCLVLVPVGWCLLALDAGGLRSRLAPARRFRTAGGRVAYCLGLGVVWAILCLVAAFCAIVMLS